MLNHKLAEYSFPSPAIWSKERLSNAEAGQGPSPSASPPNSDHAGNGWLPSCVRKDETSAANGNQTSATSSMQIGSHVQKLYAE